ncbi:YbjN domain-containing protein [Corynebacterium sp. HS2168-gen11]|uniref:YbjN domain-containing protein n=1 Tax=Corynebacterium sp. HS2168-gen11 TaxID=2974027 RepID=UPI00216ACE84|nr:YbjN domain-containing protein [Corynebacterium sp. HS2168-gen11]MCS4534994.1 YbjN domain-containing protein [Corynebacterium sp. HS2168-gen11]
MSDTLSPVTPERIVKIFSERGIELEWNEDTRDAFIVLNGYYARFALPNEVFFLMTFAYPNIPAGLDETQEFTDFLRFRNANGTFGTVYRQQTDEGVDLVSDQVFLIKHGLTDDQLSAVFAGGLSASIEHMDAFCEKFELQPPVPTQ